MPQSSGGSNREAANLLEIKDNDPKYVVTMDELAASNINGIKIVHPVNFLLDGDYQRFDGNGVLGMSIVNEHHTVRFNGFADHNIPKKS